jgi:uncharacterized protein (TIGR02145 family)
MSKKMRTLRKLLLTAVLGFSSAWCAAQANPDLVVCVGQSFEINSGADASSTVDDSPAPSYQWLQDGQVVGGTTSAAYASSSGIDTPGEYSFVRVATAGTCAPATTTPMVVKVVANPAYPVITAPASGITGMDYVFTTLAYGTADYQYQWVDNGGYASGNSYTFSAATAGILTAAVKVVVNNGCQTLQSSASVTVGGVGATGTFTDARDGKVYKAVVMPDGKTWMAQNLNYTEGLVANASCNMANGKIFTTMGPGIAAIGSYWCPPANESTASGIASDCATYGALYTWETVMSVDGKGTWDESWVSPNYYDSGAPGSTPQAAINNARDNGRGICPSGWHVPTELEWATLFDAVDGDGTGTAFRDDPSNFAWEGTDVGVKMKSAATYTGVDPGDGSWEDHANRGNDATGFGATPAGNRPFDSIQFYGRGRNVTYWSSSVGSNGTVWGRDFYNSFAQVHHNLFSRSVGFSVRCVRD